MAWLQCVTWAELAHLEGCCVVVLRQTVAKRETVMCRLHRANRH